MKRIIYACNLHWQYYDGTFDTLGDALYAMQELVRLIPIAIVDRTATEDDTPLKYHPFFCAGFQEYSKHANEYRNVFT